MHKNSIGFTAEFNKHVEFQFPSENKKIYGELIVHPKRLPLLDFKYHDFEEVKSFDSITCTSTTNSESYRLVDCRLADYDQRDIFRPKTAA